MDLRIDNLIRISDMPVAIEGMPVVIDSPYGPAVAFAAGPDMLLLNPPQSPLGGTTAFTLEALFRPDPAGPLEQRFVHLQSTQTTDRVLLETRMGSDGASWYADTFIGCQGQEMPLNDRYLLHPLGHWHTLALTFDGTTMRQYVNAAFEMEAPVPFYLPLPHIRIALGARINRIWPFAGAIARVRITPAVLAPADLLRP